MSLGLSEKFNILKESPLDRTPCAAEEEESAKSPSSWVASRFNVHSRTAEGQLILWNTYSGSLNVFTPEQVPSVKKLLSQKPYEAEQVGLVKYLVERGFLIQAGVNEYRRFQLAFGQKHFRADALNLTLLASEDCNFRCEYCYEDFARGTMAPEVRAGVRRLVEERLAGLRYLEIGWFGGEPLYGLPAIEELAPFFHQSALDRGIEFVSHITTNGYLLTPEVAEKLLSWRILHYQITIDGAPQDHDCKRPTRDGRGTFSVIFENIKSLSKRSEKFVVDVRVNYDRDTYVNVPGFFDLLKEEIGNDPRFRLRLRAVGRWGGDNDSNLNVFEGKERLEVQNRLVEELEKRGFRNCDDLSMLNGMGSQVCYAARPFQFLIGATGKVMKCTVALDKEDHNVVGRLTSDGDLHLDHDKVALWSEPAFSGDKQCQKCVILPSCQGIACPLIRIRDNASPCPPLRRNMKEELRSAYRISAKKTRRVQANT